MSDYVTPPQEQENCVQCGKYGPDCGGHSELASATGYAASSELSEIINAARDRGCAEHGHEVKWLIELPMTDEEMKRFNDITGWPSRKQHNDALCRPADSEAGAQKE